MSFDKKINLLDPNRWSIGLATHLGTPIPNETCEASLVISPNGIRGRREHDFATFFKTIRTTVAGYNCIGQVFACRRTAITGGEAKLDDVVKTILAEDGLGEVPYTDLRIGDIVVYSDDTGVLHAARVMGVEVSGTVIARGNQQGPSFLLHSKFDDISGEYEHNLEDLRWIPFKTSTIEKRFYRDRQRPPQERSWRSSIARLEGQD
jgi:hypothetical protein